MNNLTLAHAWVLLLLPLPLLVWWFVPPHRMPRRGLVVPFLPRLAALVGHEPDRGATVSQGSYLRWLTVSFCWFCVILAAARPQLIEPPVTKEIPVRDLLLAVDLSGSMETQDFKDHQDKEIDRLTAVKTVLDDFLAKREGDRVGLILFGSAAFVQVPFTEDLDVCRQLLEEAQVRMAGPQTAFGDALGLAINVFDRSTVNERVLIALTDGNDTTSQVPPDKAAQIAKDKGIVIHTVAVGDPRAVGEDALDETTLKRVASSTGGIYSHASDGKELQSIYDQLDKIETRKVETVSHRPRRDIYWWPLVAGLMASMLHMSIGLLLTLRNSQETSGFKKYRSSSATLNSAASAGILPFAFHFIRPEWLLALIPAALLWWLLHRQTETQRAWRGIIAPQLLDHLWGGEQKASRFGPLEWVGLSWLVVILAIAGPTWKHIPSPFADDTAALAVVVKVSPSMETEDIQPSRQERAAQKIHDLLSIRGNAKTSLIAYSGTAHIVMPATDDAGIIDSFSQALMPKVMPQDGDVAAEALQLADETLEKAGGGSILWTTDSVAPEQSQALGRWRNSSNTDIRLLPPLLPGEELDNLKANARASGARVVPLTADDSDVQTLASAARFADVRGGLNETRWAESGYWLTPALALMLLVFFRRGWMVSLERASTEQRNS